MNNLDLEILRAILDNEQLILSHSIHEFAERINVSASKITKCCQKMGLSGYKQLKAVLQFRSKISGENAFIILLKIEEIKKELEGLEKDQVNYELFQNKYDEFYQLLSNAENGKTSELMDKVTDTLVSILRYYICLSENEDEEYYFDFYELIVQEVSQCLH